MKEHEELKTIITNCFMNTFNVQDEDITINLPEEAKAFEPDAIEAIILEVLKDFGAIPDSAIILKKSDNEDCRTLIIHDVLAN